MTVPSHDVVTTIKDDGSGAPPRALGTWKRRVSVGSYERRTDGVRVPPGPNIYTQSPRSGRSLRVPCLCSRSTAGHRAGTLRFLVLGSGAILRPRRPQLHASSRLCLVYSPCSSLCSWHGASSPSFSIPVPSVPGRKPEICPFGTWR